jgi:hypothetical protein
VGEAQVQSFDQMEAVIIAVSTLFGGDDKQGDRPPAPTQPPPRNFDEVQARLNAALNFGMP